MPDIYRDCPACGHTHSVAAIIKSVDGSRVQLKVPGRVLEGDFLAVCPVKGTWIAGDEKAVIKGFVEAKNA